MIKMWLESLVEETDERGRKTRTTEARDNRRGIPQGSPISPLLANLYMRRFVLGWKMLGLERSLGSRIVTYADDLVILCRTGKAEEALRRLRELMGKLKLTVNEEKTRICKVPEGEFTFLGYSFGRMYSARTGKSVSGVPAIEKEHQAHGGDDPCAHHPIADVARDHRAGGQVEPHAAWMGELYAAWMGELLPSRHRHQSVPGDRQLQTGQENGGRKAPASAIGIKDQARVHHGASATFSIRLLFLKSDEFTFVL